MNKDFPRILTLLRKERSLSQKQVAIELNVSQALLSHYESGRRECGLDFVVKASEYYDVTCDYLLGCSPYQKQRPSITETMPDEDKTNAGNKNILATLNKTLLINSLHIFYDLLGKIENRKVSTELSSFLMLAIYRAFRLIYKINPDNKKELFSINDALYIAKSGAVMGINEATADMEVKMKKKKGNIHTSPNELSVSYQSLNKDYPSYAASLLNLINQCEKKMQ